MAALCDVNVLIALNVENHIHHKAAMAWVSGLGSGEGVICRIVQLGTLRLLNSPKLMGAGALSTNACSDVWKLLLRDYRFCFVAEEPKGIEDAMWKFMRGRAHAPNLWTDAYLAAFAQSGGHTLVTFDQGFRDFRGLKHKILS